MIERIPVRSKFFEYQVVVGAGAWRELRHFARDRYTSTFILTEPPVWRHWGARFLRDSGLKGSRCLFVPSGERSKSLSMLEKLAWKMLRHGADRGSLLVLFGGGVVGDLGGFLAASYMRGIDCIQVPTTVLAQVDSSIGGKTAVNVQAMKNLVGAFHPPRLVLSEPAVSGSLAPRDFRSGWYEVVKHAVLEGPEFFDLLCRSTGRLAPQNATRLSGLVARAVRVKVDVVNRDEREKQLRFALNLGHTYGHALEEATHYRRFVHGEAVGWGMIAVSHLARRLGVLPADEAARIIALVRSLGPLPSIQGLSTARIARLLPQDKKTIGGKIQWVLPERIGKVKVTTEVPNAAILAAFRDAQNETF
jgi:3-dehydroquinate synthase